MNMNLATDVTRLNPKGASHGKLKTARSHQTWRIWHFDKLFRGARIRGSSWHSELAEDTLDRHCEGDLHTNSKSHV